MILVLDVHRFGPQEFVQRDVAVQGSARDVAGDSLLGLQNVAEGRSLAQVSSP